MTDGAACKGDGQTQFADGARHARAVHECAADVMIGQVMQENYQAGKSSRRSALPEQFGVQNWIPVQWQAREQRAEPSSKREGRSAADSVEPRGKHTRIEESDGVRRLLPNEHSTWHYQLQGQVDFSQKRDVFDVDLYNTSKADIAKVKANGGYAIAYMNAGAWQPDKPDSGRYPQSLIGKIPMDGWPQERWLDIRQTETLRPIIREKMELAKAKGFDAVEPDNMDGYTHKEKYFPLTEQDQIRFNKMVAEEAHRAGLAVLLKNSDELVPALAKHFDGSVVEEAFQLKEARNYQPMRDLHKPVFSVEYKNLSERDIAEARQRGFNLIRAGRNLRGDTQVEN